MTLPLELVLGARVWRRPGRLAAACAARSSLPSRCGTSSPSGRDHWTYASRYITGWTSAGLPVEELAFFVVIPMCGLLTFEVVRRMLGDPVRSR